MVKNAVDAFNVNVIDENIVNGYEYWFAVNAYDGPDNWAGALVDPMENSKAKDATITNDNTVALIPQVSPAGLDKGGVTGVTHHGLSTATFNAITADPFVVQVLGHSEVTLDDLKSKGYTYQVDFHEKIDSIDYFPLQYSPAYNPEGNQIYFTARRGNKMFDDENIYSIPIGENGFGNKVSSLKALNTDNNEGSITFSENGDFLIYTSCKMNFKKKFKIRSY